MDTIDYLVGFLDLKNRLKMWNNSQLMRNIVGVGLYCLYYQKLERDDY